MIATLVKTLIQVLQIMMHCFDESLHFKNST